MWITGVEKQDVRVDNFWKSEELSTLQGIILAVSGFFRTKSVDNSVDNVESFSFCAETHKYGRHSAMTRERAVNGVK